MINSETAFSTHTIVSGLTQYNIGFVFSYNPNNTPQLLVYVNKLSTTPLVYGVDYTISSDQTKVILSNPRSHWTRLDIVRDIPRTQLSNYIIGRIDPEQIEHDFDLAVERDQELNAWVHLVNELPADHESRIQACEREIDDIQALIPEEATETNQLADKGFVNSSIATNTANFKGTYQTLAELEAVTPVTNNDYGFVVTTDSLGHTLYNRYKYSSQLSAWQFEYTLNNSSFTAAQWDSISSGVTASDVTKIRALPVLITQIYADSGTGVVHVITASNITTISIKTVVGHTTIAGTWSTSGMTATFTPTTASDILYGDWVVEVA